MRDVSKDGPARSWPILRDAAEWPLLRMRATLIWAALAAAFCVPIAAAAASPLLAWRGPVYIVAGFAGILALGLMLVQPLLVGGYLPGLSA